MSIAKKRAAPKTAPAKRAKKQKVPREKRIDIRIERFITEYLIDGNGRRAAIAAGYSPDRATVTACELRARPYVHERLVAGQRKLAESVDTSVEAMVERWNSIATADHRELTELHRGCCRYCWGTDHLFQRTPREMREAREEWEKDETQRQAEGKPPTEFNEAGGIGYNPKRDPNPDCPECFGDGELRVMFNDTRHLSPSARLLYAGVEQTQHGLKVRTASQGEALKELAKLKGFYSPEKHEHSHRVQGLADVLNDIDGEGTGPGSGGD